jgi:hypothetical protein
MSRNMQAVGPTAAIARGWPSMAVASAGIRRSSRALGRASTGTSTVLNLVTPDSATEDDQQVEDPGEFTAVARLEGEIVITIYPRGQGQPTTLSLPVSASLPRGGRDILAGTFEE